MPNKRTGQDYLDAERKRRHKEYSEARMEKYHKRQNEKFQKAVLKGPPGKLKPIGIAKGKAKVTPLKKKKK